MTAIDRARTYECMNCGVTRTMDRDAWESCEDELGRSCKLTPIGRAREIGTEHGKAAAEAWLPEVSTLDLGAILEDGERVAVYGWPEPDLSGDNLSRVADDCGHDYPNPEPGTEDFVDGYWQAGFDAIAKAYEAAFTAAVEATVRAKCERES